MNDQPVTERGFLRHVAQVRNEAAILMHDQDLTDEEREEAAEDFRRGGDTLSARLPRLRS